MPRGSRARTPRRRSVCSVSAARDDAQLRPFGRVAPGGRPSPRGRGSRPRSAPASVSATKIVPSGTVSVRSSRRHDEVLHRHLPPRVQRQPNSPAASSGSAARRCPSRRAADAPPNVEAPRRQAGALAELDEHLDEQRVAVAGQRAHAAAPRSRSRTTTRVAPGSTSACAKPPATGAIGGSARAGRGSVRRRRRASDLLEAREQGGDRIVGRASAVCGRGRDAPRREQQQRERQRRQCGAS